MKVQRLPNGNLLIPVGSYENGLFVDDLVEITRDDPRYAEWEVFLGTEWEERELEADSHAGDESMPTVRQ